MTVKCPTCDNAAEWTGNPYRPFCSERCKLLDLGKWLNEEHRMPIRDDAGGPFAGAAED